MASNSSNAGQRRYRAAVVGAGRIGLSLEADPLRQKPATHAGMWATHPRTQLVGICDRGEANRKIARERYPDVPVFDDLDRLLADCQPDIVSIATGPEAQREVVVRAIAHRPKMIICEKPLSVAMCDGRDMVAATRAAGIPLIVNHSRRFDVRLQQFRSDLAASLLGEILQVSTYYVYGLISTGTHVIDTLRCLFGEVMGEIQWVAGWRNERAHHPADDPCIDGVVGFAGGLRATLQSLNMRDYDIFEFVIHGRKGKAVYGNIGRRLDVYPVVPASSRSGFTEVSEIPSRRYGEMPKSYFAGLAENVVACLDGASSPLSTGEDALRALMVLLAMRESASCGGIPVRVGMSMA